MASHRPGAGTASDPSLIPPVLTAWLSVFRSCFTAPVWNHILVLVTGVVLAPGRRTVSQALRVMGLADDPGFGRYHEVLESPGFAQNFGSCGEVEGLHLVGVLTFGDEFR